MPSILVVTNGTAARWITDAGMPGPSSATEITSVVPRSAAPTTTSDCAATSAFSTTLKIASDTLSGCAGDAALAAARSPTARRTPRETARASSLRATFPTTSAYDVGAAGPVRDVCRKTPVSMSESSRCTSPSFSSSSRTTLASSPESDETRLVMRCTVMPMSPS